MHTSYMQWSDSFIFGPFTDWYVTDSSLTVPLLPFKCRQGHDDSSKNQNGYRWGKNNDDENVFVLCKPPPCSVHSNQHTVNSQFLSKACPLIETQQNDLSFPTNPAENWLFLAADDKINRKNPGRIFTFIYPCFVLKPLVLQYISQDDTVWSSSPLYYKRQFCRNSF